MYYMNDVPDFALTLIEVVENRSNMIQCYYKRKASVKEILNNFGVTKPTFYKYLNRFKKYGKVGLQNLKRGVRVSPKRISAKDENGVIFLYKNHPYLSSYEIGELEGMNPRTIQRIYKRNGLKKTYKPKSEKKKILEQLKKDQRRKGKRKKPSLKN